MRRPLIALTVLSVLGFVLWALMTTDRAQGLLLGVIVGAMVLVACLIVLVAVLVVGEDM